MIGLAERWQDLQHTLDLLTDTCGRAFLSFMPMPMNDDDAYWWSAAASYAIFCMCTNVCWDMVI